MEALPTEQLRFYSQNGEDQLLWDLFERKRNGNYIDVGAFDGIYLSNTYSFYSQGWRGVCIEPNKYYYEALKQNRNGDVCINAACLDRDDETTMFTADLMGLYSTASLDVDILESIKQRYELNSIPFAELEEYEVDTVTIARAASMLMLECQDDSEDIDFISIDIEGMEFAALTGIPANLRPRVFVIEENDLASREKNRDLLVNERSYVLARSIGVNSFYVRDKEDAIRLREIPIHCAIEKVLHPLGAAYTLPAYRNGRIIDEQSERRIKELEQQADEASTTQVKSERTERGLRARIDELTRAVESGSQKKRRIKELEQQADEASTTQVKSERMEQGLRARVDELTRAVESGRQKIQTQISKHKSELTVLREELASAETTHHLELLKLQTELERGRDRLEVLELTVHRLRVEIEVNQAELNAQEILIQGMTLPYKVGYVILHPVKFLIHRLSRK